MTQCILSNILTDDHKKITKYYLELFYNDCLEKDKYLDHLEIVQQDINIHRRHIKPHNSKTLCFIFYLVLIFIYYRILLSRST